MRVFPDIPVCVKGNETRMGKGKGAFEFWACRLVSGREWIRSKAVRLMLGTNFNLEVLLGGIHEKKEREDVPRERERACFIAALHSLDFIILVTIHSSCHFGLRFFPFYNFQSNSNLFSSTTLLSFPSHSFLPSFPSIFPLFVL